MNETTRRWPWFTLLVAVIAASIHAFCWSIRFEFDRSLIASEPWRLFTGHLTHFQSDHLIWDVALWLAFGVWAERLGRARWVATVICAAVAISAAVLCLQPQFLVYRGLSGLDSAAFAFVTGHLLLLGRRAGERKLTLASSLALVGFLVKCGYEAVAGGAVFVSNDSFEPVPLAHLVGALCGVIGMWPKRVPTARSVTGPWPGRSGIGGANG